MTPIPRFLRGPGKVAAVVRQKCPRNTEVVRRSLCGQRISKRRAGWPGSEEWFQHTTRTVWACGEPLLLHTFYRIRQVKPGRLAFCHCGSTFGATKKQGFLARCPRCNTPLSISHVRFSAPSEEESSSSGEIEGKPLENQTAGIQI